MHEMSIAVALIDQLEGLAVEHGFEGVESVDVQAGMLRGIVPEALEMAFREASRGTVAEGARLDLEIIPAEAVCRSCGHRFAPDIDYYVCEKCGRADVELVAGMDVILRTLQAREGEGASS